MPVSGHRRRRHRLPLINYENRQGEILTTKALMKEGGIIASEAPRHPFPAMHPAVRDGLLETARRLDPWSCDGPAKPTRPSGHP